MNKDEKTYLARVFLDIVNADSVIFSFETDWFFKMLEEYDIDRTTLMEAEKCSFATALNELRKWKHEADTEERQKELEKVLENLQNAVMGPDHKRLCSKFEATIIAAFDLVVISERAEIFNPKHRSGMHFNKEEIIYLDNADRQSRTIEEGEYKQISHAARLVNSRFIYVPHVIERFVKDTDEYTMKRLLGFMFPSSLPNGLLNPDIVGGKKEEGTSQTDKSKKENEGKNTIDGLYAWLKSKSVSPFIYRVIGEQLFGSPEPAAEESAEPKKPAHPISGPMIVMKLRTSHELENEKLVKNPDFLKFTLDASDTKMSIPQQAEAALNGWIEELKKYTRSFDIRIDLEAEKHFMTHTFHRNIFNAMVLGSKVIGLTIDVPGKCLRFEMASKLEFEEHDQEQEPNKYKFSFSIPFKIGELALYTAILAKTRCSRNKTSNWRGYVYTIQKDIPQSKNAYMKSAEILNWIYRQIGNNTIGEKTVQNYHSNINQRIMQNRLLNDKEEFAIKSPGQFWTLDFDRDLPTKVVFSKNYSLTIEEIVKHFA